MLGVRADNHHAALAANDLALFADGFYAGSDFHGLSPFGPSKLAAEPALAGASLIMSAYRRKAAPSGGLP
jgi:hypothetical protein